MQDIDQVRLKAQQTRVLVLHEELAIDKPVQAVWPTLFKYHLWNPEHIGAKVTRVAGTPDQEGDLILEYKKHGDAYLPPIAIEIVKIIPYRKLVWRLFEPGDNAEMGFVDFTLETADNGTRLVYNSYGEIPLARLPELPSADELRAQLARIFGALKKYIEGR